MSSAPAHNGQGPVGSVDSCFTNTVTKDVNHGFVDYTKVETKVTGLVDYYSLERIDVTISRRIRRATQFTKIGHLKAYSIDKREKRPKQKTAAWLSELLLEKAAQEENEEELEELREVFQELYNKSGTPKARRDEYNDDITNELRAPVLIFIDDFELYPGFRTHGEGVVPMRLFLETVPHLIRDDPPSNEPAITVVLSPAKSATAIIKNNYSEVEV